MGSGGCLEQIDRINNSGLKTGDIVVAYFGEFECDNCININIVDLFSSKKVPYKWFVDDVRHFNYKGNEIIAEKIYTTLLSNNMLTQTEKRTDYRPCLYKSQMIAKKYFNKYFRGLKNIRGHYNGAIVMNCNPFTKGHRYLIDYARKLVDYLIVFVVEEDCSEFSFEERYSMVVKGTSEYENVIVVPSGELIASKLTFSSYFGRVFTDYTVDELNRDAMLFSKEIAPLLGIKSRFLGTEKRDRITAEYNKVLKNTLPYEGIRVVEIPRLAVDGEEVSASVFRKDMMDKGQFRVSSLPRSTIELLNIGPMYS